VFLLLLLPVQLFLAGVVGVGVVDAPARSSFPANIAAAAASACCICFPAAASDADG
jgi:hypothetical protein